MFKKPTKKQFIIRRVILSSIATLSVLIIATAAILFMLGYRLDSANGSLQQGALLQFDTRPGGADVSVDGKYIGSRTATKQTVVAGTHSVKMSREGYQDWNRTVDLAAGTLTWLDYIRLVPTERPVQKVATYQTLVHTSFSPDGKWALTQEKIDAPTFHLIDLRAEDIKSTLITIPEAAITDATTEGVTHSFTPISWNTGGRYILMKHQYKDQTDWLVVDSENVDQTVNVTQLFSIGLKDLQFSGTSGKVFYALTNEGTIRKVDLGAATVSRTFVTHAEAFTLYDNKIISYIGVDPANAAQRVAGVFREGDETPHVLRTVESLDVPLKIATGQYFNDYYFAIAEGSKVSILKGSYPSSSALDASSLKQFASFELTVTVSALSLSPNGDYVLAQSGEVFRSYEIEHTRGETGTVAVKAGETASKIKWLDAAHLWNDDGGMLTMRDFNGLNMFAIMNVERGFDARLSQNGRFFYAVGKTDTGYHLQRVKMILN